MLKTITFVAVANLVAVALSPSVAQAGNYNHRYGYQYDRCYHKHHGYTDRYYFRQYGYCYIHKHKKWY
jgi:hypothetical protein